MAIKGAITTQTGKPWTGGTYTNYGKDKIKAQAIATKTGADKNLMSTYLKNQQPQTTPRTTTTTSTNTNTSSYHSTNDDIVSRIKKLLEEQKAAADEYYKTLYEQQLASNKEGYESNRNQVNRNFLRGNRYLNSLYDGTSGPGITNRARNYQNWQSSLATNRQNYTNNDATALANYNQNKANAASQLAQGWYNYVLPVYTNRQQNQDDYDYRKYIASL